MSSQETSFEECVVRYQQVRSLDRWPSRKFAWNSLGEFLDSTVIDSGIHSIRLNDVILDIYLDIVAGAPVYVYFHGNCPRAKNFKLPVFSGSNVLESLRVTKIVPSDPILLLDDTIELSWHAGCSTVDLQAVYRSIFEKVFYIVAASEIVFWGGSGGGFAALYYSHFFPGSTAMVWNPQTIILRYLPDSVEKYLKVAFGTTRSDLDPIPSEIVTDVANLYREGYTNKVIYIQNDDDWHVTEHLAPFLAALGVDYSSLLIDSCNKLVAPNFYLFIGHFSKDHEPPSNVEIHSALQECYEAKGDPTRFDFARLINGHHYGRALPAWAIRQIKSRRLEYFRPDWPHYSISPLVDTDFPYKIVLSTGVAVDAVPGGDMPWSIEFERDVSTNIHELYALTHVGRLLSAYQDNSDLTLLNAAIEITKSFLDFIKEPLARKLVMTNRGHSSADHSMSIRASVLVKVLQVLNENESCAADEQFIADAIGHLWDIADVISDPINVYPSNHGIMSCLALVQIANQFGNLRYIANHYLRSANVNLIRLISGSFDKNGWANENTVGYHSFILRLLNEYLDYCGRNGMVSADIELIRGRLRRGEQALGFCVRQDGSIPPIGDSPLYRPGLQSINHSKLFGDSGFLIIKDDVLYVSLICGSRSDNHKQVDDSSLTLHYDGEDLVIDGGSYCYDSTDPYRKYLVSFRGHSGLFPEVAGDMPPKVYLLNRKYAAIEEFMEFSEGRLAKARYRLGISNFECERRLLVDHAGKSLIIMDQARSDDPTTVFNQSFLLAPHLKLVERLGNVLVFEGERYGVVITQYHAQDCIIENGLTEPIVAGWCSIDWREKLKTYQLRFTQNGRGAHYLTKLDIFELGKRPSISEMGSLPTTSQLARVYS